MGINLYVGGYGATIQGEHATLEGSRCFSAAHRFRCGQSLSNVRAILDSGAFTDPPDKRLSPPEALERQIQWEQKTTRICSSYEPDSIKWQAESFVSYDRLIDEVWIGGRRRKQRWSIKAADAAVEETVIAAQYLASQRESLFPRSLLLSVQGVDAHQYAECCAEVLHHAVWCDWIGLGGWCILGRWKSWLPEYFRTLHLCLPMIAAAGVKRVHIFGVLWEPALAPLLWLADQLGLSVSTDSSAPILSCTYTRSPKKAGVRCSYWRDNVAWWINRCNTLRSSPYYREPPVTSSSRQTIFNFD